MMRGAVDGDSCHPRSERLGLDVCSSAWEQFVTVQEEIAAQDLTQFGERTSSVIYFKLNTLLWLEENPTVS